MNVNNQHRDQSKVVMRGGASPTSAMSIEPAARVSSVRAYSPQKTPDRNRGMLKLDSNEGPPPDQELLEAMRLIDADALRQYPNVSSLEARIARDWGVDPVRIVVTSGGDDAIDRLCKSVLEPGREILLHRPTFEMIAISAKLAGADVRSIDWMSDSFPVDEFIHSMCLTTRLVALVSPNNPTGGVINTADILSIAETARRFGSVVLVDFAYVEFADDDPTSSLLDVDNIVIVRTFSKARGLAGLRAGYAVAPHTIANWLRQVGSPYPVSSVSVMLANASLGESSDVLAQTRRQIRYEREKLTELLCDFGASPLVSQANFVTARFANAASVRASLLSHGISVRAFLDHDGLKDFLRITLPCDAASFDRLVESLTAILRPRASDILGSELGHRTIGQCESGAP